MGFVLFVHGRHNRIDDRLDRTVAHCLEKDPGQRFQSASDLAFALRSIVVE